MTYAPTNIKYFASTHETSVEIALAIFETAEEGDEERLWQEPTDEEMLSIMELAWTKTDGDGLSWGCETFHR